MSSTNVTLCPVQAAAVIVCWIKSYPEANHDTPISTIWRYNRIEHITSTQIRNALQDAIKAIKENILHISVDEIETHSICSEAAMVMILGGCPVFLIMMIGRWSWSSDVFLRYIRKQVDEFNHNVSQKMLTHMLNRHIQNYSSPTISHLDPRQCNHPNNAATRINVGGDMAHQQARLPAFAQFAWALQLQSNVRKSIKLLYLPNGHTLWHFWRLGSGKWWMHLFWCQRGWARGFESL